MKGDATQAVAVFSRKPDCEKGGSGGTENPVLDIRFGSVIISAARSHHGISPAKLASNACNQRVSSNHAPRRCSRGIYQRVSSSYSPESIVEISRAAS